MTVRDIFELRKQGKIEEAYDAIRPMYAAHKGRYTSLCMFWTAADIFKKRLREGRTDEAAKIYEALKRVLPYIKDSDKQPEITSDFHDDGTPKLGIDKEPSRTTDSAAAFMQTAARRLTQARQLEQLASSEKEKFHTNEASFRDFTSSRHSQEESHTGIQEEVALSTQDGNSCDSDNSCSKKAESSSEKNSSSFSALSEGHREESPVEEELQPSEEDSLDSDNSWSKKDNSSNSPLKEAQNDNLSSGENISAVSALSASKKEPSASEEAIPSSEKDNSRNSQNSPLQEDLSGHLAVSLDEGIIRPIEGLNAVQRVVLACVVGHPGYSVPRISESTGIPQKSIERHVAVLIDRGLIEYRDSMQYTGYYPL